MVAAIGRGDPGDGSVALRLAAAGLDALRRVVDEPAGRDQALELLAADALLTFACEAGLAGPIDDQAAAEAELMAALDPRRFADLLDRDAGS